MTEMNNAIKNISAVSVLWLLSQSSIAELKQIDDDQLSNLTGQAGITIDIEFGHEVGEFMYKDEGSIVMQGMRIGGMDYSGEVGTQYSAAADVAGDLDYSGSGEDPWLGNHGGNKLLNNARVEIDIADGIETFDWAWSYWSAPLCVDCQYIANDGDLIIHASIADPRIVARSYQSVDFGIELDKFAIKDSSYEAGDDITNPSNGAQSTTILSNMRMEGYLGGFDLIVENNGNGFTNGVADSKIKINTFFEITEMEYDYDIIGVRYEGIKVHNTRGELTYFDKDQNDLAFGSSSQGFAQASTHIYAVRDAVLNVGRAAGANGDSNPQHFVDGVAFDSRFAGDMDIAHISFGDTGQSIGEIYFTDIDVQTNRIISAH